MPTTRRRRWLLPALLLLLGLVLSACGSDADKAAAEDDAAPASDSAFPVSVDHAFGTTTIDAAPKRVVTWGWGSADAAIALGTIPVAMPFQEYGGDAKGVLPWIADALTKAGADTPADRQRSR